MSATMNVHGREIGVADDGAVFVDGNVMAAAVPELRIDDVKIVDTFSAEAGDPYDGCDSNIVILNYLYNKEMKELREYLASHTCPVVSLVLS